MTVAFYSAFLNIPVKLLPSRCVLCSPHNHVPCHVTVNACLAVSCHCTFGRMAGIFFYVLLRVAERYQNKSLQKVDHGENNSPAAPAGTRTRDLSSPAL